MSASRKVVLFSMMGLGLAMFSACTPKPPGAAEVKKIPENQQYSGFLKDYGALQPNANVGAEAMTYVHQDKMKSMRRYIAIIVDPVELYVSTNADSAQFPQRSREAVANYFQHALVNAVQDAFPVVDTPGPLVLRLRSALVGIDLGGEMAPAGSGDEAMKRAIVLEKVGVEMELVDSQTGERIAAFVDKEKLGSGAQVGSVNFSREERFAEARLAFDEWAGRVRAFLDSQHELTGDDATKADAAYRSYGQ